jgi:hypothetical protein
LRHSLWQTAAAALGLTTITLIWVANPLINFGHEVVYHWTGTAFGLFAPVILDICIAWALVTLVLMLAERTERGRVVAWLGIVAVTPTVVVKSLVLSNALIVPRWMMANSAFFAAAVFLTLLLLWRTRFEKQIDQLAEIASTVFGVVGFCGALLLLQLVWSGWRARGLNDVRQRPALRDVATYTSKPRIIWIIFDELSQQQTYDGRLTGLRLPAFDAFAAEGTMFTEVLPADVPLDVDPMTEKIVPSLLTGVPVDGIRSSLAGELSMHNPDTGSWQRFDQFNTVFHDALKAGYNTAVVGWFNPYCRMMPDVLNTCYWTESTLIQNGMLPDATVGVNMMGPTPRLPGYEKLTYLLGRSGVVNASVTKLRVKAHIEDYEKISAAADVVLRDHRLNFVFIHMDIPHMEGIYNRRTGQYATGIATYQDNLVLADKYLEHVRSVLVETGEWDNSAVVIMGDHGWRTRLWRPHLEWTAEEERASGGGRYDRRPAYLVKMPGQRTAAKINQPFPAIATRRLMHELMSGQIQTVEALSAWTANVH